MPEEPAQTLPDFAPVPRLCDRSNGWKPEVQRAFIEALAETGSVKAACRRVGRADHGAYLLRRHPEAHEFRKAWEAALDLGVRRIEDAAMDRALNGVEETVFYHGGLVGRRTRYNERLVMFILRSRAPHRFAAGPARALNAVDEQKLARLKKQWRKEWEADKQARAVSPAEVRQSIDRKVLALRRQVVASTSPRAFEHELAKAAQMRADEAAGWRPGFPYAEFADQAAALLPKFVEQVRAEYPPHPEFQWCDADRRAHGCPALLAAPHPPEKPPAPAAEPPADKGPRIRSLKGEWD